MTKAEKIRIYKEMADVFSHPPEESLFNNRGLCDWLIQKKGLSRFEIKRILGRKYSDVLYMFGGGYPQCELYEERRRYFLNRSKWCKRQIEKLENKQ